MSSACTFLLLGASVLGLAGCYDLSAPEGPGPEDFARSRAAQGPDAPADEEEAACTGADCPPAESALTTKTRTPRERDRSQERVSAEAVGAALQAR
jgi:hypothetical protein